MSFLLITVNVSYLVKDIIDQTGGLTQVAGFPKSYYMAQLVQGEKEHSDWFPEH